MAGTRNQARVSAQLRLRRQVEQHDRLVVAYYRADAAVAKAKHKIEGIRADYQGRLSEAEAARDEAVRKRSEVLAAVAVGLGDDQAAGILDLPVSRVRGARRSVGAARAGRAVSDRPRSARREPVEQAEQGPGTDMSGPGGTGPQSTSHAVPVFTAAIEVHDEVSAS